jgi:hypothetical protein
MQLLLQKRTTSATRKSAPVKKRGSVKQGTPNLAEPVNAKDHRVPGTTWLDMRVFTSDDPNNPKEAMQQAASAWLAANGSEEDEYRMLFLEDVAEASCQRLFRVETTSAMLVDDLPPADSSLLHNFDDDEEEEDDEPEDEY